jgi:carbonic anhydrase
MVSPLLFLMIITLNMLQTSKAYDFSNPSCLNTAYQQSPINIILDSTYYYDEKYFRFLTNNYNFLTTNNKWTYFQDEKAVGIAPTGGNQTDFGSFIFVKDWAMYSYKLQKILFRTPSEHNLDGQSFDVEMQLIHTNDANYYSPGRRIDLQGVDYLVISIFFKVTDDNNPAKSQLFQFMNLEKGLNARMLRPIKLHHIIQHQPSYLYTGSLTYPVCQKAQWLVFSQYHSIGQTDFNNLQSLITSATGLFSNTRNIFPYTSSQEIYRNWNDMANLLPNPTLMVYNSSCILNISYTLLFSTVFMVLMIIF